MKFDFYQFQKNSGDNNMNWLKIQASLGYLIIVILKKIITVVEVLIQVVLPGKLRFILMMHVSFTVSMIAVTSILVETIMRLIREGE